jgi:PiT family inorganic phosphate transporter
VLTLLIAVILIALVFEYINGFHDTANSIATVVATKVLSPMQAVALAAVANLLGALWGTAVAKTIASGLLDTGVVEITSQVIICALLGGIIWNLVTWYMGLPSSSSHALIGGLCGAAIAAAHNQWAAVIWSQPTDPWYKSAGVFWKVVVPMVSSPLLGFAAGFLVMGLLFALFWAMSYSSGFLRLIARPRWANAFFGKAQIVSASFMGLAHGLNDAQKTMGIIALALVGAEKAGTLHEIPQWLEFLRHPMIIDASGKEAIATWIKIVCALTMAFGTAAGGWKIIKTMGHKMVKLQPVHGFAAETTAATVLSVAAYFGMPVSTTHAITTSIMGVGCAKRFNALRFNVVERILWAWVLTIPASALMAYLLVQLARFSGWIG